MTTPAGPKGARFRNGEAGRLRGQTGEPCPMLGGSDDAADPKGVQSAMANVARVWVNRGAVPCGLT